MTQRVTVGYIELTEEESERLFDQVKEDKGIGSYDELQGLMDDFDSRVIEPETKLADVATAGEPAGEIMEGDRFIEIFNKLEEDSRYRIRSSDQSIKEEPPAE